MIHSYLYYNFHQEKFLEKMATTRSFFTEIPGYFLLSKNFSTINKNDIRMEIQIAKSISNFLTMLKLRVIF